VKQRAQALLDEGKSVPEVGVAIGVAGDTLRKAIGAGRLHRSKKNADSGRSQRQQQERAQ
jgi:hypothetical protein